MKTWSTLASFPPVTTVKWVIVTADVSTPSVNLILLKHEAFFSEKSPLLFLTEMGTNLHPL